MDGKKRYSSFLIPLLFVIVLWAIKLFEIQNNLDFGKYGIYPKSLDGLKGIFFTPLIHGDINHLLNNSIPLLVLGTTIFFFYREVALKLVFWSWLMTGIWVWSAAVPAYHIGASGVVYAMASFIFFSGVFRKHYKLMSISLMVVFLYGSMVWGIFPIKQGISWESHLYGSIAGLFLAYYYRKTGLQKPKYEWEDEDNDMEEGQQDENKVTINYIYKVNNSLKDPGDKNEG